MTVELAYADYFENLKNSGLSPQFLDTMGITMTLQKKSLFKDVLFKDFPEAMPIIEEILKQTS